MVKEIIAGIKKTETEAAGIIEEAKKKKAELVARAREDARKMVEAAQKQGNQLVKQANAKAQEDAQRRIQGIADQEAETRKSVVQASSTRVPKAVETVIERVLQ